MFSTSQNSKFQFQIPKLLFHFDHPSVCLHLSRSGAFQREPESVCEAGGVSDQWPIPAVHRGLRDHPILGVAHVPLPETMPGVGPAAAHQRCRAPGQNGPQPHFEEQRQALLWAVQDQLSRLIVWHLAVIGKISETEKAECERDWDARCKACPVSQRH